MARLIGQLPNVLTLVRILLVAPIAWAIWTADYRLALLLLVVAGVSDLLDGELARRFNWQSEFGATIDPVADKLLVFVLAVLLTVQTHVPLWLALIVVLRDVVILAGAAVYRVLFGELEVAPTWISKVNTAVQVIILGMVLLALCRFAGVSDWMQALVAPWGFLLLAVLAIWSGMDYVVTWGRRAVHEHHRNEQRKAG
jgi:cardiolipin synthase